MQPHCQMLAQVSLALSLFSFLTHLCSCGHSPNGGAGTQGRGPLWMTLGLLSQR